MLLRIDYSQNGGNKAPVIRPSGGARRDNIRLIYEALIILVKVISFPSMFNLGKGSVFSKRLRNNDSLMEAEIYERAAVVYFW